MAPPSCSFQPSLTEEEALARASELWGIEPVYWDIWGKRHKTAPEVQRSILAATGVPYKTRECLDEAVERRLWRDWSSPVPSTLVISESDVPHRFPLTVPVAFAGGSVTIEIQREDGSIETSEKRLDELLETETASLRGEQFSRKQAPLPENLPLGYHSLRVTVRIGRRRPVSGAARLIVCPDKAWLPPALEGGRRTAGVAVSLYGVRSRRNWGCGDFTDLVGIIDWVIDDLGGGFVALNPLHAIPNRQPFNTSPYLPTSVFFRNVLYLDVERLTDFQNSPFAQKLFRNEEIQGELESLRAAPLVEYERVHALKLRFLRLAFTSFRRKARTGSSRDLQFREYKKQQGEILDRFAVYCALEEHIHAQRPDIWVWPDWPEPYRDPGSKAVRQFARRHRRSVEFFKYVQWQLELQLAAAQEHALRKGMPIGLYHDLALATDRCGSDLWAHRAFFVSGCRVGSPPDDFAPDGQDWSFPPPAVERHRESGYELFVESIRRNCQHGGALRIDHVMRLFRLFWIPEGLAAAGGTYVRDYHEDLLRILALESVRNKVLVIGEDLGTVEPRIREELHRFGILSYRLLYFEKNTHGRFQPPGEYPRQALVSISTHDLPTLAGFWTGADIEVRRRAGILPDEDTCRKQRNARARDKQTMVEAMAGAGLLPDWHPRNAEHVPELNGELHNAAVGFLAETPSMLMVLTQEDLLKETEQQNLPGTTWQYPNWRRKMRFTIEELRTGGLPKAFAAMFRNWLKKTGRLTARTADR